MDKNFKIGDECRIVKNSNISAGDCVEMYHYLKIGTRVKVIGFLVYNNIEVETEDGCKQAVLPEHIQKIN